MKAFRYFVLFLILFIASTTVNAQLKETKNYIYFPYSYNFCAENPEISVSIPENWGFRIPPLENNYLGLRISYKMARFTMSEEMIDKPQSIFFITPEGEKPCLELRIAAFGSEQTEESIQSSFGKFYRTNQIEDEKTEAYQCISDLYVVTFRILTTDEQEKQICKDIIESATSCYEALMETYSSMNDGLRSNPFNYFANDSTYYPEMGFLFVNPHDMEADIKAANYVINESQTRLDAFVTLDELVDEDYAGIFYERDFNMKYTFIKRMEDEGELRRKVESYIKLDSYRETCQQHIIYPVNGLAATMHILGNTYYPTIAVVIPAKDYEAVFVFESVPAKKLADVETILSLMRVEDYQKEGMRTLSTYSQPLREMISGQHIEREYATIQLDKKASTKDVNVIVCSIPEAKAEIVIPALSSVVTYPAYENPTLDNKKKRYNVTLQTKNPTSDNEEETSSFCAMTFSDSYKDQVVVWIFDNEENFTVEEYFLQQQIDLECKPESDSEQIKRLGKVKVKGKTWYVMTTYNDDFVMDSYMTENNGIIIVVRILSISRSEDADIVNKTETLLQKASFK